MGTGVQQSAKGPQTSDAKQAKPPNNLPPRDPKFMGRFAVLNQIHELFRVNGAVGISQSPAPHSCGGIGKTAIAIAYAWNHLADYPGGVFFVNGRTGLLAAELAGLGEFLNVRPRGDQHHTALAVCERLASGPRSLVIFDGVEDAAKWNRAEQQGIVPEGNCRCLITTVRQSLSYVQMCVVDRLSRDEGVMMLSAFRPDAGDYKNEPIAGDIVDLFDGLPIGLTLVAGYMALKENVTWESCRDRMKAIATRTIPNGGSLVHTGRKVPDYVQFVQDVFDEVLNCLPKQVRLAMEYASLLPENHIVNTWLRQFVQSDEVQKRAEALGEPVLTGQQVVAALLSLQVLRGQSPGYRIMSMPRILRARMKEHFENNEFQHKDALERVIDQGEKRAAVSEFALEKPDVRATLTPLIEFAKELRTIGKVVEGAQIANKISLVLHRLHRYQEVTAMLDEFLEGDGYENLDPPTTAVLLSDRAVTMAAMGLTEEARRHMERAIQIEQKHLPANHPTLASHYSNLAGILKSLGELDKAKRLLKQAITIEEEHFGADHPTLGLRHWWVGDIDLAADRSIEALGEYWRAHEILTKHYPSNHPHVRRLEDVIERQSNARSAQQRIDEEESPSLVAGANAANTKEVRTLPPVDFHGNDSGESATKALDHVLTKRKARR